MDWIDFVQWPATVVTVAGAWLVASPAKRRRNAGFWIFLLGNLLWIGWALYSHSYALVVLQIALAAMNIRGAVKTEEQ